MGENSNNGGGSVAAAAGADCEEKESVEEKIRVRRRNRISSSALPLAKTFNLITSERKIICLLFARDFTEDRNYGIHVTALAKILQQRRDDCFDAVKRLETNGLIVKTLSHDPYNLHIVLSNAAHLRIDAYLKTFATVTLPPPSTTSASKTARKSVV